MGDFRELDDPDNPENRNAGNGGDLVKHAVYLALLRHLGPGLAIRECHAGRGIYRVPRADLRRRRLARLFASSTALAETQRAVLARLRVDPEEWYAGSALLVGEAARATRHEAYEWDPRTRAILRAAAEEGAYAIEMVDAGEAAHFDGESHVAERIGGWGRRDLVLLDPFGLWRHARHDERRARYRRIFEARRDCPMAIFFTWGQDARGEAVDRAMEVASNVVVFGDLADAPPDDEARRATPRDGYGALRGLLPDRVLRVRWRCDLRCAIWIVGVEPAALHGELVASLAALWRDVLDPSDGVEIALTAPA